MSAQRVQSSRATRLRVGDAFGWRCAYCGVRVAFGQHADVARAAIEHVEPLSRGGTEVPANEVLTCWSCNGSKGSKTLREWLEGERCDVPRWRSFAHVFAVTA